MDGEKWSQTLDKAIDAVVTIDYCHTHPFDTNPASNGQATGFVVDAEKRLILTNRHVVGAGPFFGQCTFHNNEKCSVSPVYRDPVHDYSVLRFDPNGNKYVTFTALALRPDNAKVGVDIWMLGNDAGAKLSILQATISKVDCNAPNYSEGYCDFNTNYIQASASASAGSSGSPVIDRHGYAIAMQVAGRKGTALDFLLPLNRAARTLRLLGQDKQVTRGTIQTQWILKTFYECRELGLTAQNEEEVRTQFPKDTGMLVAEVVLPQGPACSKIEQGDILLSVDGELLTQFFRLDAVLDENVGQKIDVAVQRAGKIEKFQLEVGDLHTITPNKFVTVSGALFHELSYQRARRYGVSLKDAGVCVRAETGSFKLTQGSTSNLLIQEVAGKPTPTLEAFIEVIQNLPDGEPVPIKIRDLEAVDIERTWTVPIDRHWDKTPQVATRNDETGSWDFQLLAAAPLPVPPRKTEAAFVEISGEHPEASDMVRSCVHVRSSMRMKIEDCPDWETNGSGIIVDADCGYVLVSKAFVPHSLCDISLMIAGKIDVKAVVVFSHPSLNYAIVQYDASLVGAPVKTPKFSTQHIKKGAEVTFFGSDYLFHPLVTKTTVADITSVSTLDGDTLRYRATNFEAITLDTDQGRRCSSGVLLDKDSMVQAFWLVFLDGNNDDYRFGISTPDFLPILDQIRRKETPKLRILDVEFQCFHLSQSHTMGLSQERIQEIEAADPERHQVFQVDQIDSILDNGLKHSDILLKLDGTLVSRYSGLDIVSDDEALDAVVVRNGEEMSLRVLTVPWQNFETNQVIEFCGAILHPPHRAVRHQMSKEHSCVYISSRVAGSPACMYKVRLTTVLPTPALLVVVLLDCCVFALHFADYMQ
ncbi:hypothetical protein ACJQWK_02900 [Exserohilum turcicum]